MNISPLSLNQLTRDTWGAFDPPAIWQLAPLNRKGFQPKFYKAPDVASSLFAPYAYLDYGVEITPGSLIYGICLPQNPVSGVLPGLQLPAGLFSIQITDASLKDEKGKPHKFWDEPISSGFCSNFNPTYLDAWTQQIGSSIHLFNCPHPVIGSGLFSVEIWETGGVQQRIEVVLAVAEAVKP